ncbi:MAG: polyphosphate kinase 2 family protein [Deltaproteobacteria bacterium]|nr:polyphosphate kinase 2 family protein [Deltaproteobacteria bacterium]
MLGVHEALEHRYLVPFDGAFRVKKAPTEPPDDAPKKKALEARLEDLVAELRELQHVLYAHDRRAVLLIFQAMDAAGKDGTIRAVLSGVNPAGCRVTSFKAPSSQELDHDFLWRTSLALPERGTIGIFNRSYYEEVLVVRVHPEYLERQQLPAIPKDLHKLWERRYASIRDHEEHLARNGTVILKFWLNVSKEEQQSRFLERLDTPEKNWKFNPGDVLERAHWDDYMTAYEEALAATSRSWAPWYAVPADSKAFMRVTVAEILVETLKKLGLRYPEPSEADRARFDEVRAMLERDGPG